jgi:hypothetical protein
MKKIFGNTRFLVIVLAIILSIVSKEAFAHVPDTTVPVELKYIGQIQNKPLFQLSFSGNAGNKEYSIIITDENGVLLFQENSKGECFSKKFLLNTDELGDAILRFEIRFRGPGKRVVYEISRRTHLVQEMEIAELK